MRKRVSLIASVLLSWAMILPVSGIYAETPLDQAIEKSFPPTIATASLDDIVTAGAVMTLKVKGVLMFATTESLKAGLTYREGKLTPNFTTQMAASNTPFHKSTIQQRTYVTNEKLWLIDVKDASDGVVLQMLSDAVNNIRYTTFIKFPFPKGGTPSPGEIIGQIAQVMTPEGGSEAAAPVPPPPPQKKLPELVPPTPPTDMPPPQKQLPDLVPPAPPTDISPPPLPTKGQTKDEVVSVFGQPVKAVNITASKEIDTYNDMKITYENGKVSKSEPQPLQK